MTLAGASAMKSKWHTVGFAKGTQIIIFFCIIVCLKTLYYEYETNYKNLSSTPHSSVTSELYRRLGNIFEDSVM